jgi:hypothetical protein
MLRRAPGNAAVPMADVRLPEILRAVPAAVEVLEITLLVDMFVAVEVSGGRWIGLPWIGHVVVVADLERKAQLKGTQFRKHTDSTCSAPQ